MSPRLLGQISDNLEGGSGQIQKGDAGRATQRRRASGVVRHRKRDSHARSARRDTERKRQEFDSRMAQDKEDAQRETEITRRQWDSEKKAREIEAKEWDAAGKRRGASAKRRSLNTLSSVSRGLRRRRFRTEKTKLEREMSQKSRTGDRAGTREAAVAAKEQELDRMQKKASMAPKEMETAVYQGREGSD